MLAISPIQTHRIPFGDIDFNIGSHVFTDCRCVDVGLEILGINTPKPIELGTVLFAKRTTANSSRINLAGGIDTKTAKVLVGPHYFVVVGDHYFLNTPSRLDLFLAVLLSSGLAL
jgi:hypothetical protein